MQPRQRDQHDQESRANHKLQTRDQEEQGAERMGQGAVAERGSSSFPALFPGLPR